MAFGRAKRTAARPMRGEEGSYLSFTHVADEPDLDTSTIDAAQFPSETHPQLSHISERIRSKTSPALGETVATAELIAPHTTGFSAKHEAGANTL